MEGPKVTEEIRRSDGDPTRSEIREYHLELSLDLVSRRAIPECARERECYRWVSSIDRSRVSLDWVLMWEEGVDDVERIEASLMTSAMSGSAIADRCTVT